MCFVSDVVFVMVAGSMLLTDAPWNATYYECFLAENLDIHQTPPCGQTRSLVAGIDEDHDVFGAAPEHCCNIAVDRLVANHLY